MEAEHKRELDLEELHQKQMEDVFGPVIMSYTSDQAVDDGMLISTDALFPHQPQHLISHITTNLMQKGYETKGAISLASVMDLCNFLGPKIRQILGKDTFLAARVEGPNGDKFKVFAEQNEKGRWTVMLPEDH